MESILSPPTHLSIQQFSVDFHKFIIFGLNSNHSFGPALADLVLT